MTRLLALALLVAAAACGGDATTPATRTEPPAASASGPPVALDGTVNDEGKADLSGQGARVTVTVTAGDNYFAPTYIKAQPGATVNVTVVNAGRRPHTFTVPGGSADATVPPGERTTVTFALPRDSALRFVCSFHVGGGMQGAFWSSAGQAVPAARDEDPAYDY